MLERIEAQHSEEVASLEDAAELRSRAEEAKERILSLTSCGRGLADVGKAVGELQAQVRLCDERAVELQDTGVLLQASLQHSDAQLSLLRRQSAELLRAAERGESDLHAGLLASEERRAGLEREVEELMLSQGAADALQEQLDESNELVASLEAAAMQLQAHLEDLRQRRASATSWQEELNDFRAKLVALHGAEGAAHDSVARLQGEIDSLRAEREAALQVPEATARTDEAGLQREAEERVSQAASELSGLQAQLDARERRIRLLAWQASTAAAGAVPSQDASRLRAAERRAAELEALVTDHGARLDACEERSRQLRRWLRSVDRRDQERDRVQSSRTQVQRPRHASSELAQDAVAYGPVSGDRASSRDHPLRPSASSGWASGYGSWQGGGDPWRNWSEGSWASGGFRTRS